MSAIKQLDPAAEKAKVVGIQERRLGRTVLRTYRAKVDIDDIVPNEKQPRLGPKEDEELQRQIEANEGLFEPLLVEPHPDLSGKFRIIDGDRRWTNSQALVAQGRDLYRQVPVEVTDRTLSDEERLRVWIYIHRQRKEWDAKEKEMVAYRLVDLLGRASAANILGITVRELDKLVEIFELSERFTGLRGPAGAAITWARELRGVSKKLLTPSVTEAVVAKVNQRRITNSKELRKLRTVLRDSVAAAHFLTEDGDIESSMLRISAPRQSDQKGLLADLSALCESLERRSWTELEGLRGNIVAQEKIREATKLLERLGHSLGRDTRVDKAGGK
jgi:ParB family transcriptional regulator, chromosome partitioning protein